MLNQNHKLKNEVKLNENLSEEVRRAMDFDKPINLKILQGSF